jgi:hypothetical protein
VSDDALERFEERVAICVEAGVNEQRARVIAACEALVRAGGECACGAGHAASTCAHEWRTGYEAMHGAGRSIRVQLCTSCGAFREWRG